MSLRLTNVLEPEVDVLAQVVAPHLERREAPVGRFELARGSLAIRGEVQAGRVRSLEVSTDPGAQPVDDRAALARALVGLGFALSVRFVDAGLPELVDEEAVFAWLRVPPPPGPREAHDLVLAALARGEPPDRELISRALGDPRADELIATLASGAPPPPPRAPTRDRAQLERISGGFHAYAWTEGIGGYANRARSRYRESGAVPRTPAAARLCLFFEQRRRVHTASDPTDDDWRYYEALLDVVFG